METPGTPANPTRPTLPTTIKPRSTTPTKRHRRIRVQLEFFPFPDLDPLASSFMCSIRVADLEELHAAVAASVPIDDGGIPRLTPVARQAWGQRAGYLVDLDGTQLALIEERGPDG